MKFIFKLIKFSIISLSILLLIYFYGVYFGAKGLKINEYKIESETITSEFDGLKIVHLSDIHYGLGITKSDLENVVDNVNQLKPDICVITGDLVNNTLSDDQYKDLVEVLSKIDVKIGSFVIDGNHDYKYNKWNDLLNDTNLINLNDSYEEIFMNSNESIFLAGVSNNTYSTKNINDKTKIIFDYINSESFNKNFNILLMHEPDFIDEIDYKEFDLILAGHSHNGQVRFPLIGSLYTPKYAKKYHEPYYKLENTDFYISSGLGTSELPVRLFNKPSFNLYRIVKKQD